LAAPVTVSIANDLELALDQLAEVVTASISLMRRMAPPAIPFDHLA